MCPAYGGTNASIFLVYARYLKFFYIYGGILLPREADPEDRFIVGVQKTVDLHCGPIAQLVRAHA